MAAPFTIAAQQLTTAETQALLDAPAGDRPAGITNPDDPINFHVIFITTLTLHLVFSSLAVLIRIFTKSILMKSLAWEDCRSKVLCLYIYLC